MVRLALMSVLAAALLLFFVEAPEAKKRYRYKTKSSYRTDYALGKLNVKANAEAYCRRYPARCRGSVHKMKMRDGSVHKFKVRYMRPSFLF